LLACGLAWLAGSSVLAQQTTVQAAGIADRYDSLLSEAMAALSAGDLPKAEKLAFALTMLDERRYEAFAALGVLYARQNKPTQASEAFASAKELAPKGAQALAQLLELAASPRPAQTEVKLSWYEVLAVSPDPKVVIDEDARARMRATNFPWRVRDRRTGIVMLLVPPGTFKMGSSGQERRQAPQYVPAEKQSDYERWITNEFPHDVVISRPFYLAETELTQAQWLRIARELHSSADEMSGSDTALLPVERVSWDSCQRFCELSGLRLPSEAEWEYACRAGTSSTFSFGACIDTDQVNYDGDYPYGGARAGKGRGRAVACGGLSANPWGFHEMHGNVWEWCQDCYKAMPPLNQDAPTDDACDQRVVRGGGWRCLAMDCRSAARAAVAPSVASVNIGVRLARNSE